jgi:hypothetical protein
MNQFMFYNFSDNVKQAFQKFVKLKDQTLSGFDSWLNGVNIPRCFKSEQKFRGSQSPWFNQVNTMHTGILIFLHYSQLRFHIKNEFSLQINYKSRLSDKIIRLDRRSGFCIAKM